MIIVGLLLVITLINFILYLLTQDKYKNIQNWNRNDTYLTLSIIMLLLFLGITIRIPSKRDIDFTISKYKNLKEQVDGLTKKEIIQQDNLREEIYKVNNMIDKNKIYSDSPLVNVFYSKRLGELDKIKINK